MSTRTIVIPLQPSQTGLTLTAQLLDGTGTASGTAVTTGFFEIGGGFYLWTYGGFPTQFRGVVRFTSAGIVLACLAINPEELENVDAIVSSRSTFSGGAVASVIAPVTVGTNNDKTGYTVSGAGVSAIQAGLSTYSGGPVASVSAPVTVGTNNDKTGYAVSATGLNLIPGFNGWSFPQMLRAVTAFLIGKRTGVPNSGSAGMATYQDPSNNASYGTVSVDANGNITADAMTPPA